MAEIRPFCGIRYNEKKVRQISKVVAPPYDIISPKEHRILYKANPYNFVRLLLDRKYPIESDNSKKYDRAADFLRQWLKKGIFIKDDKPAIYIYEQKFIYNKTKNTRRGFIALLKLQEFKNNVVYPHEKAYSVPKRDRTVVISKTRANLSPVFSLFLDKRNYIDRLLQDICGKQHPQINIRYQNVEHRLWQIVNPDLIEKIKHAMKDKQIFIADGHHRYEAALAFRDMMYKQKGKTKETEDAYGWCLVYFLNLNSKGLLILPTHRVVRCKYCKDIAAIYEKVSDFADIKRNRTKNDMLSFIKDEKPGMQRFGIYLKGCGFYSLILKQKVIKQTDNLLDRLGVNILHNLILDTLGFKDITDKNAKICYTVNPDEAIRLVRKEGFDIAFFLNPTKIAQVRLIAESRQKMPHKSTYFYPKLLCGLVFYKFKDSLF